MVSAGRTLNAQSLRECQGNIDSKITIDSNFTKVIGWIYGLDTFSKDESVIVYDPLRKVIGYGVFGLHRPDVMEKMKVGRHSGFGLYVRTSSLNSPATIYLPAMKCSFPIS